MTTICREVIIPIVDYGKIREVNEKNHIPIIPRKYFGYWIISISFQEYSLKMIIRFPQQSVPIYCAHLRFHNLDPL